jgi:Rod binding domain-containing protein
MNLPPPALHPSEPSGHRDLLMQKAREMETAFLSEMLAHSGLGQSEGPFGGGEGEAQFASFLRQEQARLMVEKGGVGLAELIFRTLSEASDVTP